MNQYNQNIWDSFPNNNKNFQSQFDLKPVDNDDLINEVVEVLKQLLDYVPASETDIWNKIHNYLKYNADVNPSEYDKITLILEQHINENILGE